MIASTLIGAGLLGWTGLIVALGRRAERCATNLSGGAALRAAAAAILIALCALGRRSTLESAAACGAVCIALLVAADADARTGYLFDAVTLPTATVAALLAVAGGTAGNAAAGVLLLVLPFGALVALSDGRLMGLGDVKAMYAIGAAFGPLESLVVLLAACLSGIVAAALHGRLRRGTEVRFGPHLAAGSAFGLVAAGPLVHRTLGL